jgi:hypothetical protein
LIINDKRTSVTVERIASDATLDPVAFLENAPAGLFVGF